MFSDKQLVWTFEKYHQKYWWNFKCDLFKSQVPFHQNHFSVENICSNLGIVFEKFLKARNFQIFSMGAQHSIKRNLTFTAGLIFEVKVA